MKRPAIAILAIGAIVAFDQIVKQLVERHMDYHQMIELVPFFALFRTHNQGIAFSMLSGLGPLPLIVISLGVIAFVLWLWRGSAPERWISHAGFALIIGGAIGNLIDRVWHGYVIDYFLFHTPVWSFAVFNLADAAITVGAGLVILDELIAWWRQRGVEKAE
ncbi:signal peptidase II [Oricola sp.]|uniref:signal peptidase II n=1 Tax=Oricola sp. TaxID=1979950 RepID=UPI003BA8BFF7